MQKNIERFLVLLFNLLGAGRGGDVNLSDKKPLWFSSKVDYRQFKCASYSPMDNNIDLIKGIFDYYHLDMKTHNKYPDPAAEIPLEPLVDPQVVMEDNVYEVFLYEAAFENRDNLHASEAELTQVGQEVEDG